MSSSDLTFKYRSFRVHVCLVTCVHTGHYTRLVLVVDVTWSSKAISLNNAFLGHDISPSFTLSGWLLEFYVLAYVGDFIVLPHWETIRPSAPCPDISNIPCPILIMPSTWLGSDRYTFLSNWFNTGSKLWVG